MTVPDSDLIWTITSHTEWKPGTKLVMLYDLQFPGQSVRAVMKALQVARPTVETARTLAATVFPAASQEARPRVSGGAARVSGGAPPASQEARPDDEPEVGAVLLGSTSPPTGARRENPESVSLPPKRHSNLAMRVVEARRKAGFRQRADLDRIEAAINDLLEAEVTEVEIMEWAAHPGVRVFTAGWVTNVMNDHRVAAPAAARPLPRLPAGAISRADDERKRHQDRSLW